MKYSRFFISTLLIVLIALSGCGNQATSIKNQSDTLEIYTSIYPIEDFTKKIGDAHVTVKSLLSPGTDAHTFEPTAKTMIEIANSDALLYNGVSMEGYITAMKKSLKNEHVTFFAASEGMDVIEFANNKHDEHEHAHQEHNHGSKDPHVWLDPIRAITLAKNIKEILTELKPEAAADFEKNFETLKKDLQTLNEDFQQMVANTPNDTFLVSHAAYGYWEDRYGLQQLSISGLSPTSIPSQKQLTDIIEKSETHHIQYVLFEQNVSEKVAKVIQQEINAKTLRLHNLSVLLEEDIDKNEDYFSLMRKNIETLKKSLQ